MLKPKPRGELSQSLFEALGTDSADWSMLLATPVTDDDDLHIALWTMYELSYHGFEDVDDSLEWDAGRLGVRRRLEAEFERTLRDRYTPVTFEGAFDQALFALIQDDDGPSLATFVRQHANREQALELLRHRSVYHLKESDPVVWVVPRLSVRVKAALMELQYDEYGCGDPNRLHSGLFARGIADSGLSPTYGAYVDDAPFEVLAQNNAMSMFGVHRRLRGAALGHLAAFEATSSLPSRKMAQGLTRLGFPESMVGYYNEHVEADAVHEQLAIRTICGTLVEDEPALTDDIQFGAFTCLDLEARFATRMQDEWAA
ncbi:MAG: iron-containing redox enzyme family protein [Aeromicrobium sp.]